MTEPTASCYHRRVPMLTRKERGLKATTTIHRAYPYLVIIFAVLVVVFLINPLQDRIRAFSRTMIDQMSIAIKPNTGLTISYESMGPNVLRSISLENFKLTRSDGSVFAKAQTLRFSYNPWLLLGGNPISAISSIDVSGFVIFIDPQRDGKILRSSGGKTSTETPKSQGFYLQALADSLFSNLTEGTTVSLSDGTTTIGSPGTKVVLGIRRITGVRQGQALSLSSGTITYDITGSDNQEPMISGSCSVNASYSPNAHALNASLHLGEAKTSGLRIRRQDLSVVWLPEGIHVRKIDDQQPLDVQGSWEKKTNYFQMSVKAQHYPISSLVVFEKSTFPEARSIENAPLDIDLHAGVNANTGVVDYAARIGTRIDHPYYGEIKAAINLDGDAETVRHLGLNLDTDRAHFAYNGLLRFKQFALGGDFVSWIDLPTSDLKVELDGRVNGTIDQYDFASTNARIGKSEIGKIAVSFWPATGSLKAKIEAGDEKTGAVQGSADLQISRGLKGSIGLSMEEYQPFKEGSAWLSLIPDSLKPMAGSETTISTRALLTLGGTDRLRVDVSSLEVSDKTKGLAFKASGSATQSDVLIRDVSLVLPGLKVSGKLECASDKQDWMYNTSFLVNSIAYQVQGRSAEGFRNFEFTGSNGLLIAGGIQNNTLAANVSFASLPLPLKAMPVRVSMNANTRVALDGSDWGFQIVSGSIEAQGLLPANLDAWSRLNFRGTGNPKGISIPTIKYIDPYGALEGSASANFAPLNTAQMVLKGQTSSGLDGKTIVPVSLQFDGSLSGQNLDASINLAEMNLDRLTSALSGRVNAKARILGTLSGPKVLADATVFLVEHLKRHLTWNSNRTFFACRRCALQFYSMLLPSHPLAMTPLLVWSTSWAGTR